jgi:hypothetical protein
MRVIRKGWGFLNTQFWSNEICTYFVAKITNSVFWRYHKFNFAI